MFLFAEKKEETVSTLLRVDAGNWGLGLWYSDREEHRVGKYIEKEKGKTSLH